MAADNWPRCPIDGAPLVLRLANGRVHEQCPTCSRAWTAELEPGVLWCRGCGVQLERRAKGSGRQADRCTRCGGKGRPINGVLNPAAAQFAAEIPTPVKRPA